MKGVLTGSDPLTGAGMRVHYSGGRIDRVERVDVEKSDGWLSPGLVDIQVNGFAGHDVNAADVDANTITALAHALFTVGVTTFVPTVITGPSSSIERSLRAIADARATNPLVAHSIPYAHLEGPHISDQDGCRGVHPVKHVRPPSISEFRRWQEISGDLIGMITLSPHYPGTADYVRTVAAEGVHVAIGHTHASPDEVTAAVDAGATLSTHLGNGAPAIMARHPNFIWAQLADDRLTAGFIADGHHLPADTLRVMLRAKGLDRALLVSDAVALAGSSPGTYDTPVGGQVELSSDGRLSHVGTPYLAGAARSLADCVAQATILGRLSLADALRLATTNPGRFVGGRGTLRPGAPADVIGFQWGPNAPTLRLTDIVVSGQRIITQ